jgi:hypothetical protein
MALNLKKVKMPAPKGKDPMFSLDMSEAPEEGSPEEEAAESPEEEASEAEAGAGEETPEEEQKELEEMPDDVLVKELKKRGYQIKK